MKTYKIGNTEINEYDINNLNHDYIKFKFDELLEALADKEEYYDHSNTKMWLVKENGKVEKFEETKQEENEIDTSEYKHAFYSKNGRLDLVAPTKEEFQAQISKALDKKQKENTAQKIVDTLIDTLPKQEGTMSEAEWREHFDKLDRDFPVISLQKDTWETVEEPKQEEKKGVEIVVCPAHGNIEYNVKPPHYCKNKIGEGCNCVCVCKPKQSTAHVGISNVDEDVTRVTYDGKEIYSKQSTSLKEETREIIINAQMWWIDTDQAADEILSLLQSHLLKEMENYSNIGLVTNEDIIKIINNIK